MMSSRRPLLVEPSNTPGLTGPVAKDDGDGAGSGREARWRGEKGGDYGTPPGRWEEEEEKQRRAQEEDAESPA